MPALFPYQLYSLPPLPDFWWWTFCWGPTNTRLASSRCHKSGNLEDAYLNSIQEYMIAKELPVGVKGVCLRHLELGFWQTHLRFNISNISIHGSPSQSSNERTTKFFYTYYNNSPPPLPSWSLWKSPVKKSKKKCQSQKKQNFDTLADTVGSTGMLTWIGKPKNILKPVIGLFSYLEVALTWQSL